jgi:hypothetical protein
MSKMQGGVNFEPCLALFHLILYFKISEIHLNFGSMLILVG